MSYTVTGRVHYVGEITEVGKNALQKREFVLETLDQYPQLIKFELIKDKTTLIDTNNVGASAEVHFDLRGREWNEKYFTSLQAWKINIQSDDNSTPF